jgi:hypothetical protein
MSAKPISQREARALKRRVRELETDIVRVRRALGEPRGGTWIRAIEPASTETALAIRTASRLGFTVVARFIDENSSRLNLYAIPTEAKRNV